MAKKLKIYNGSSWEDVTFAITPPTTSVTNSFTTNQVIDASTSAAALRITQRGSGEAFRVEDETNPDSTPFVIHTTGLVGIGTASPDSALHISAPGDTTINLTKTGQSTWYIQSLDSGVFRLYSGTANAERLKIDNQGTVTVGNSLQVTNDLTVNGIIYGAVTAGRSVINANFNTLTTSGFYRINNNHTNGPGADWGQLIVSRGSDTITQIYGDYNSGALFTRSGNPSDVGGGGSWQPWRQVVDTINGGKITAAQSTTDARIRNIYTSTSNPSGGLDGDMWAVYV